LRIGCRVQIHDFEVLAWYSFFMTHKKLLSISITSFSICLISILAILYLGQLNHFNFYLKDILWQCRVVMGCARPISMNIMANLMPVVVFSFVAGVISVYFRTWPTFEGNMTIGRGTYSREGILVATFLIAIFVIIFLFIAAQLFSTQYISDHYQTNEDSQFLKSGS
jgi:hypothetical protein